MRKDMPGRDRDNMFYGALRNCCGNGSMQEGAVRKLNERRHSSSLFDACKFIVDEDLAGSGRKFMEGNTHIIVPKNSSKRFSYGDCELNQSGLLRKWKNEEFSQNRRKEGELHQIFPYIFLPPVTMMTCPVMYEHNGLARAKNAAGSFSSRTYLSKSQS